MVAWMLLLVLAAPTAENIREAERLAAKGVASFRAEAFAQAGDYFIRAYELSAEPTQLRNAAKAFEAAGATERAREYWKQFSGLPGLTPEDRAEAEAHLQPPPAAPIVPEERPLEIVPVRALVEEPASESTLGPWIFVGAGAAAASTALILYVAAANREAVLEERLAEREGGLTTGVSYQAALAENNTIRRLRVGSGLALAVGTASLATGLFWMFTREEQVSVAPIPGGAIATFGGAW